MNQEDIRGLVEAIEAGRIPPDYAIKQSVKQRMAEQHPGVLLAAGGLTAFAVGPLLGWMAAGGVALVAFQLFSDWRKKNEEDWEAIEDGTYAHLLNKEEQRQYDKLFGKGSYKKVLEEQTRERLREQRPVHSLPASPEAEQTNPKNSAADAPAAVGASVDDTNLPVRTVPVVVKEKSDERRVFEVNRFGQAQQTTDGGEPSHAGAVSNPPASAIQAGIEVLDIAQFLGNILKPTIITAKPRVGKGIAVAHGWRKAKELNPDLTVWVIQPKPDPKELGYWEGVDRFWGKQIEFYPVDDETICSEIESFILEWRMQSARPTLLIIDELVKIEAMLPKWYQRNIPALMKVESSSGETDQRFLWAITQSPLVSDLGLKSGNRSAFEMVAIERAESLDHAEAVRSSIASLKSIPHETHFKSSPVGCLCYHTAIGKWKAVPRYEVPQPSKPSPPPEPPKPVTPPSNVVEIQASVSAKVDRDQADDEAYAQAGGNRAEFFRLIGATNTGGSFLRRWQKAEERAKKPEELDHQVVPVLI